MRIPNEVIGQMADMRKVRARFGRYHLTWAT
jgi:hypothetical protein